MSDHLPQELIWVFEALEQRKAKGLVALDVRGISAVADYMVICSGLSNRQVVSIGEHLVHYLKKRKSKPMGVEGLQEGQWVLVDYGEVVVHIFYDPTREFYDLEGLWTDAKRIQPPKNENSAAGE